MDELVNYECVKFGSFKLKSGKMSNYYVDLRNTYSHSELFSKLIEQFRQQLLTTFNTQNTKKQTHLLGIPYGAIPYASVLAFTTKSPLLVVRKEPKDYGLKNMIEGDYKTGECVTIIEDVITSGQSIKKNIDIIEEQGLIVSNIFVILDREEGGMKTIRELGYKINSLHKISDIIPRSDISSQIINIANHKKSNVIFSNDCTNMKDFFDILEQVAPYICALKTHIDIISDFDESFIQRLMHLKKEHNFIVIEDQKYSDIATIVAKKYTNSVYKIKTWADIITIHGTVGDSSIRILAEQNVNMLLISQLSADGNLITEDYTKKVIEMAEKNNVFGFIAQRKISTHKFLYFSPGVNIDKSHDDYGQTWNNPIALANTGTQFFIVGRGIYNAFNPIEKVQEYKSLCWDATKHNFIFNY
jgi:uridine monophosphate synthetase